MHASLHKQAKAPPLLAPLAPCDYLRLRRRAAGLTIDQLAYQIAHNIAHRFARTTENRSAEARERVKVIRDQLTLLERPGSRARFTDILQGIERVIPFDPNVYCQLADEPADRHPLVCRSCGCSSHDPCIDNHSVCKWVSPQLCSHCAMEDLR